jgi:Holliday junction DNA helicase RuvB
MIEDYAFEPGPLGDIEVHVEKSLRPARLEEFIGQRRVVENLVIAIGAAKSRGEALDHVLFSGLPGLGKTTLSFLVASALGVDIHCTSGPAIEKGRDLAGLLTNLRRGDVLFIDEVHRLSPQTEEYLYSAMEDFKVDIVLDRGPDARALRVTVEPFTLVGATTREGLLSAPFRSRFGIIEKLEPYPPSDLKEILLRSARILECDVADDAAAVLAARCRGTPRYANRFLRRIRDIAEYRADGRRAPRPRHPTDPATGCRLALDLEHVREGLDRLGIDEHGLDRIDRKILEILLSTGDPVGIKTIAVSVGEEEQTIEDVHEPYLIQIGMLVKTPRGRRPGTKAHGVYAPRGTLLS